MKSYILLLVIAIFLGSSCDDEPNVNTPCSAANPIEDLDWLSAKIEEISNNSVSQYSYVSRARYKLMTVFVFGNCCPFCNTVVPVYSCSGELLGTLGDGNFDTSILDNDVVVWKPDNFACTVD